MIKLVKVSEAGIKEFRKSVSEMHDRTNMFDTVFSFYEERIHQIGSIIEKLSDCIQQLHKACNTISEKIEIIKEKISDLTVTLDRLKSEKNSIEAQLSTVSPTITVIDEEGNCIEESNPVYDSLMYKLSDLEDEIRKVNAEIGDCEQKLNRAKSVYDQIEVHIKEIQDSISFLEEKKKNCKDLSSRLKDFQSFITYRCNNVVNSLSKIEKLIAAYIRTKMEYENTIVENTMNISYNNRPEYVYENLTHSNNKKQQINQTYSKDEIIEHGIQFDENKRISLYDGKTFGGKFNTYEDRIKRASINNPILGFYVGVRGESEYIPSGRTADGISVIAILEKYGQKGITYRNAEPDFEPVSEAIVEIAKMTEIREDNFTQADIELAKQWNLGKRDGRTNWTGRDVKNYRSNYKLTWHEKCDTKTMVLVRREINLFFKHSGGCSECRMRDMNTNEEEEFDE